MRQVRILDAFGARWSDQPPEAIAEAAAESRGDLEKGSATAKSEGAAARRSFIGKVWRRLGKDTDADWGKRRQ